LQPFQEAGPQLVEIINTFCDAGSGILATVLLATSYSGVRGPNLGLGIAMIALQALPVLATILLS
jgi:hypothetical protein